MQFLLILTSDGHDTNARYACLAASMLRRHQPGAVITLLIDPATADALEHHRAPVLECVDRRVTHAAPFDDPLSINRYLRIEARTLISGDFVYLDNDVLVVRPMTEVFAAPAEVAAVPDVDFGRSASGLPAPVRADFERLGWPTRCQRYLNSGVLLLRDTSSVHALCDEWMRRWRIYRDAFRPLDQPAFNAALEAAGTAVYVLPSRFNAQVEAVPSQARGAHAYHFWASTMAFRSDTSSLLKHLEDHLQNTGRVDWDAVDRCRAESYPWVGCDSPRRLWATGRYGQAVWQGVRAVGHRLRAGSASSGMIRPMAP